MRAFAKNSKVIFDFGMHNGDDTAFYLSRGFNVVALEANPALCTRAHERFSSYVDEGRLTIVNAAIWEKSGTASFFVNLENDHWSSLDIGWASRNETRYQQISIPCVTLSHLIEEFETPYYLKVDVEGVDRSVLEQLKHCNLLPLYVSVEDCRFGFQYMETLAACGYDSFKLFDQSTVSQLADPKTGRLFSPGSSGPFGHEVPGEWRCYNDILELYSKTVRDREGKRLAPATQWWDIHCTRLGDEGQ
ncbi:MAG TPA: FkbM family methyltransferase [Pseudolabrys sp.]|jgi:FkbM family methyltransferase